MKSQHVLTLILSTFVSTAFADGPADNLPDKVRPVPPPGMALSPDERKELLEAMESLGNEIHALRGDLKTSPALLALLPDVQIFYHAVRYALTYNEIFNLTNEVPAARALLKQGLERAAQLRQGHAVWNSATGLVVRGYVSKIDGSVQPYGLVVPASFQPTGPHRHRLDVWFHGRDEKLSELNFLTQRQMAPGEFIPSDAFVLHTYGRYCNGQKFAGEIDLFEALDSIRQRYPIDEQRLVVRGFSLGGAACWHYAVHHAGLWAAAAPGAGFSETPDFLKVFQNEELNPTWYEKKLWHLYDCTDWAVNLFNCPTVAYSGEIDRQKQAADIMEQALATEGLQLTHIIGPQTAHKYHAQSKEEINRRIDGIAALGRQPVPKKIRFTTWTLRYNRMFWVTVTGLEEHWTRARVEAEIVDDQNIKVKTENVTSLALIMPAGHCPLDNTRRPVVTLDGKKLEAPRVFSDRSWTAHFRKDGNRWSVAGSSEGGNVALSSAQETHPSPSGLSKRHGLQGPIDDAFMDSFLMVRPTGQPLNDKVGAWVVAELAHATHHWRQQFRGEARVKDDTDINEADIAAHNLVLWGDLVSNRVLAKIADRLPIHWRGEIHVGDKTFSAQHHVPVFIYPNPLNPKRYVVLNSGVTFREYDYLNNARQVPKLPDYAIVDVNVPVSSRSPGGIVEAGFFDERWELRPGRRHSVER